MRARVRGLTYPTTMQELALPVGCTVVLSAPCSVLLTADMDELGSVHTSIRALARCPGDQSIASQLGARGIARTLSIYKT